MRYFVTVDIEIPYRSFLSNTDEETTEAGLPTKWAWSDNGLPPDGCIVWETPEDAQTAVDAFKHLWKHTHHPTFADSIEVTAFSEEIL